MVVGGDAPARLSPAQEADCARAIADLEADNRFAPAMTPAVPGPFVLHLGLREGRLVFDIRDARDAPLHAIVLALGPFRGLMRDYQMLLASHETALAEGRDARIQAIDMGRRGLHDEGAALLRERLTGKAAMDFATARRLFTLVCALHRRI